MSAPAAAGEARAGRGVGVDANERHEAPLSVGDGQEPADAFGEEVNRSPAMKWPPAPRSVHVRMSG
jgi:hypothetical protein